MKDASNEYIAHVHVCMYVWIYAGYARHLMCLRVHVKFMYAYARAHMCMDEHQHAFVHVHACVCTCTHTYIRDMRVMHVCRIFSAYAFIHTYTHTYMHMQDS